MEKKLQKIYPTYCNLYIILLVYNPSEGINKTKSKYGHNDKKCETCENANVKMQN